MSAPTYPPVLREPIAADANPANITNPMPESPPGGNAASIELGFPPITMTSELAGGKPPLGQDMNGFLFLLSSHLVYLQSGLPYLFDSDVSTALGGYPVGSILGMSDGTGIWLNLVANNTTDPDSGGVAGYAAGWRPLASVGASGVATTGGVTTVNSEQAKKSTIVISGTLTSNATVILPQVAQEWLLVNATSGAFSVNVSAGGGANVTVPQGGYSSPYGAYSIGDGNLYPSVAPLSIPIDQAATPSTIVERTNAGYILATYLNQNSPPENPTIDAVFVEANSDGFLRKIATNNFQAQFNVGGWIGQVINGQIPYSAVQQWAATFFTSAALTGSPTAPTQALGNATSLIATTAFVNPGSGVTGNGSYRKNPDGSIDQWGNFAWTANGGTTTRTFPIAFPNALESIVIGSPYAPAGLGGAGSYQADQPAAPTLGGFSYRSVSSSNPAIQVYWEAKGR